jgi:hypothetical protein
MTDHYSEFMAKASEAVRLMNEAIFSLAHTISEEFIPVVKEIDDAFFKYYQTIGSPFGKGRRGYKKWIKSLSEEKNDSGT